MISYIKIQGNRQTGKSRLLAHYIKDAQESGRKVILTGQSMHMLKHLEQSFNFRADMLTTNSNSKLLLGTKDYDVLAIEESLSSPIADVIAQFSPYLKDTAIVVYTGNITEL